MRGFACIGIHQPKNPMNIGAVLRAAGCFDARMIAVAGARYNNSTADTQKAWKHIPLVHCDSVLSVLPKGCVPVAVDIIDGARSLDTYTHPERAFYIFGGEDRTLDDSIISACRDVVFIRTKFCLNLAAAVNVVLYDRSVKMGSNLIPLAMGEKEAA